MIVGTKVMLKSRSRVLFPFAATKFGPFIKEHVVMLFHGIPALPAHWNRKNQLQEIQVNWWDVGILDVFLLQRKILSAEAGM